MSHRWMVALIGVVLVAAAVMVRGQALQSHSPVEMHGVKAAMKFEAPVEGFLRPLNGKLKLRATEVDFLAGAVLGDHYHAGPGIRLVLAGELTVVSAEGGKEQRFKTREYFYESGDKSFRVSNAGKEPGKLLVIELLPASLEGSAMAPVTKQAELEEQGKTLQKMICPPSK